MSAPSPRRRNSTRRAPRARLRAGTRSGGARRALGLLLGLLGACLPPALLPAQDQQALDRGRRLTSAFHQGASDAVLAEATVELEEAVGGAQGLAELRDRVRIAMGDETTVLDERVISSGGLAVYRRISRFDGATAPVLTVWAFEPGGRVAGFQIRPAPQEASSPHLDRATAAELRLPFDGEWLVVWGGRSVDDNYHAAYVDQRFAYDLVVADEEGRHHTGNGTRNEDYHCFGRPVLAPADGTVVAARDGVLDNAPGDMNPAEAAGNHVILDLGQDEYAVLAHLRMGSLRVAPGARVDAGDTLGSCGNSGNSSEPHLHFHLQSTPRLGEGEGLPAQFRDYVADGRAVFRGEPQRGQRIRAAPPPERP